MRIGSLVSRKLGAGRRLVPWAAYALALGLAGAALLGRLALDHWLEDHQVWGFFYLAVMLSGWWLGWRSAVITWGAGLLLGLYFLMPPRHSWGPALVRDWVGLATYSFVAGLIVLLMRRVRLHQDQLVKTTEGLKREMEFSRAAIESLPGLFYLIDEQGRLRRWNQQVETVTGYSAAELEKKSALEMVPEEDRAWVAGKIQEVFKLGSTEAEAHLLTRDRRKLIHFFTGKRFSYQGRMALIGTGVDISRRIEAEKARATLAAVVEHSTDAIVGQALDGTITSWNAGAERVFGYTAAEAVGQHITRMVPPEHVDLITQGLERLRRGEVVEFGEFAWIHKAGRRVVVSLSVSPIRDPQGQVIGMAKIAHDITEQKLAELALASQNRRLTLLNEASARLLSSALPDQMLPEFFEQLSAYFQVDLFLEFAKMDTGERLELRACGGLDEAVKQQVHHLEFGQGVCGTVAQTCRPIICTCIQQSSDPIVQLLKPLGVRAYACNPLLAGGRLLGTLAFGSRLRDTFEPEDLRFFQTLASYVALAWERASLLAELRQHAGRLEQTVQERTGKWREMAAELEHMSYSMVHDLRAPLRAIHGYATVLEQVETGRLSPEGRDYLERMKLSTDRMDRLILDALNYNKAVRGELPLFPVNVAGLLQSLIRSHSEFESVRDHIRLEGDFPSVLGNDSGLTQCVSELLGNALKFVRPGQAPRIRIWAEARTELAPGDGARVVRLWFEDQGTGIPEEGRQRIFDMFQRMHGPEYEGTGIGLALVRKVMERMGGRVGVESEPGRGSRFWLELPAAEAEPQARLAA